MRCRIRGDRSLLAALQPLLDVRGVRFFGLQKGVPDDEVLAGTGGRVQPLGGLLDDFGDTAAAIEALDLVISIDTSVAHLAGALGKPVWTMLVQNADWRWMASATTARGIRRCDCSGSSGAGTGAR